MVQKILKGYYVDMAELLPEKLSHVQEPQSSQSSDSKKPKCKQVGDILQWVECFNAYTGVVLAQNPSRASDLLSYSSLIVHAARKYRGEGWVQYDVNFRRRAAAFPLTRWAEINPTLWQLAFSNATPQAHCELCFSLDHATDKCDDYETSSDSTQGKGKQREKSPAKDSSSKKRPICLRWNQSQCHSTYCNYQYICLECHQPHKAKDCSVTRRFTPYKRDRHYDDRGKQPFRRSSPARR